ncbi:MAG TPA: carboxypeptidase regulatory-like domain-containing protein, partial [Candidatus Polarisedimenticolia bacterium]|nr:carboxypeptidase regulatory-like domain-containing protein [Candidatus Polarisedimenticolia bacterium]
MLRRPAIVLSLCLVLAAPVQAFSAEASGGTLQGRVVDRDGHPLSGVTIVLVSASGTPPELLRVSDALGTFRFQRMEPGKQYRLRVSLPSYPTVEFTDLEIEPEGIDLGDIVLRPAMTERVEVRSVPDVVQPESAVTRTQISSEFLDGLPILGRDYQDILVLAPGVTDVDRTGNPNIHGARDTDVLTLVDGVNTSDPFSGLYGQELNAESIQEIEVITAGATAQYSRAQGGFVNVLTRSGGNEFKGTFKIFARSYRLDGDGAGIDPAELHGGLGEREGLEGLRFTDLYPFIALSGPLVRNRLWYFVAPEFAQIEDPVNTGTQAFIARTRSVRATGKLTWQVALSSKLSLSVLFDDTTLDNQGVNSRTDPESGYSLRRGGPTFTLQEITLFSPVLSLESSVSRFDQAFSQTPTLDADTNRNGVLFIDGDRSLGGDRDGFFSPRERDPGEDFDGDGRFDIFEDFNHNGSLDACFVNTQTSQRVCYDDLDGDGRVTLPFGCEGTRRDDLNCNGTLDRETDQDMDGIVDPFEDSGIPCKNPWLCPGGILPGTRGNGRWDTEDRNGNQRLDTLGDSGFTAFPFWSDRNHDATPDAGEFQAPLAADRDYRIGLTSNRISGPFYSGYSDGRTRDTWREDLSLFAADAAGSHDLKLGGVWERERFSRILEQRPILQLSGSDRGLFATGQKLGVLVPTAPRVRSDASGDHLGFYLQDTYKPVPNVTVGLGLRFDRESVGAWGYAPFDPAAERRQFDDLMALAGVEVETNADLNRDGILAQGLKGDPLYATGGLREAQVRSTLAAAAPRRFTRHNFLSRIISARLASI